MLCNQRVIFSNAKPRGTYSNRYALEGETTGATALCSKLVSSWSSHIGAIRKFSRSRALLYGWQRCRWTWNETHNVNEQRSADRNSGMLVCGPRGPYPPRQEGGGVQDNVCGPDTSTGQEFRHSDDESTVCSSYTVFKEIYLHRRYVERAER